jgi:hypothetical protein
LGVPLDSDVSANTFLRKRITPLDSAQKVTGHRLASAPQNVLLPDKPLGQKTTKRDIVEWPRDRHVIFQATKLFAVAGAEALMPHGSNS